MIDNFRGDNVVFSNFYICYVHNTIEPEDKLLYRSVEHAFQAGKTKDISIRTEMAKIISPSDVKAYGRTLVLRDDWNIFKFKLMYSLLEYKFHIARYGNKLIQTADQDLIEGNYWHDNIWGRCSCMACQSLKLHDRDNHLGRMLMNIRYRLMIECGMVVSFS